MQNRARWFAFFTVIVGCFALLDGVLSFLEPLPFYIYVFAAPKLPLAMVWDFWMGVSLLRTARFAVVNPFEK